MRGLVSRMGLGVALLAGFVPVAGAQAVKGPKPQAAKAATADEARRFLEEAEARYLELTLSAERAGWVQSNFITVDTEAIAAEANERRIGGIMEMAQQATRFDSVKLPAEMRRKLDLLKLSLTMATPRLPVVLA